MSASKLFTFLVVILPLTMVYKSPVPGLDLGTFSILIFTILMIASKNSITINIRNSKSLALFLLYIALSTLISILLQDALNYTLIFLRMEKFITLILIIIFVFHHKLFDYKYGLKLLRIITLLAVLYAIIQTLTYYSTGILLPRAYLKLIIDESYMYHDYISSATRFYRPPAFFIEPASFVQYVILYLTYCIFGDKPNSIIFKPLESIFITFGIILTGSGQGLILLTIVWGIWFIKRIIFTMPNIKKYLIAVIVIFGIIYLSPKIIEMPTVEKNLDRILGDSGLTLGYAGEARIQGFSYFDNLDGVFRFIGTGYGNVPPGEYFSSASYTLYTSGYIGILLVAYFFVETYRKAKYFQKVFLILYIVLIIGTTAFYPANICFYFSFLLYRVDNRPIKLST